MNLYPICQDFHLALKYSLCNIYLTNPFPFFLLFLLLLTHQNTQKDVFILVENSIFPLLFCCSSEKYGAVTLYCYTKFF